jgi:hypothetical protein
VVVELRRLDVYYIPHGTRGYFYVIDDFCYRRSDGNCF